MVSLLRKLVPPSEYRKYEILFLVKLFFFFFYFLYFCNVIKSGVFDRLLGAVVVIAANAGGAWTPIGDVTTTMLWIHGQISTLPTMKVLFSIIS